jgi:hypothetical protein
MENHIQNIQNKYLLKRVRASFPDKTNIEIYI